MSASPKKKMKYSQNKSKFYSKPSNQNHHQQYLAPGMLGFLATCNFREKDCVREAYNVLRVAADELYGPEHPDKKEENTEKGASGDANEETDDIADQLQKEVNDTKVDKKTKGPRYQRFQRVETAANNCIFIRTTMDDPVKLASKIVEEVKTTRLQKTRFLLRLIPIETVCRIDDMNSAAGKLFDVHFLKEPSTFSIAFNRRYNNDVKRDKIIAELAELVSSKNLANKVDLKNPEKTVVVEIVKGLCLMSVIPGYMQNKKFNLVELAVADKEKTAQNTNIDNDEGDGSDKAETENDSNKQDEAKTEEKT